MHRVYICHWEQLMQSSLQGTTSIVPDRASITLSTKHMRSAVLYGSIIHSAGTWRRILYSALTRTGISPDKTLLIPCKIEERYHNDEMKISLGYYSPHHVIYRAYPSRTLKAWKHPSQSHLSLGFLFTIFKISLSPSFPQILNTQ